MDAGAMQETFEDKVVFCASSGGSWQIWAVSPDGEAPSPVSNSETDLLYPAIAPGGDRMAWADTDGNIWVKEKDGSIGKVMNLPPNCNHPSWSPDGARIVFSSLSFTDRGEEGNLWVGDLTKKETFQLIEQEGIQKHPCWSPDGATIVYTTGRRVSRTQVREDLWLVDADGTKKRPLLSNGASNIQPAWSPAGEWVAFASDVSGNMEIWVVDKNGGSLRKLTDNPAYDADPSWSPDGEKICFTSARSGRMEIWVMNSDGSNPVQLTRFGDKFVESKEPHWMPLRNFK